MAEILTTGDAGPAASEDLNNLLRRVGQRDRAAFSTLYAATSGKLFGVISRIAGRGGGAEDLLQEVFVKIWERAADFDAAKGSALGWMATIARNRALDEVRRSGRTPTMAFPEGFEPSAELGHPLDGRERSEALQKLLRCLAALEDEKRQLVLLAYYNGATREALAERFKRPVPTIKTWLRRSLDQLRVCLSS